MHIDAHFHIWQLSRGDYAWLTPALTPIYRNVTVADWQQEAAAHQVHGGVLVQAAPTEAETRFILEQANAHTAVLGVVGWVDMLAPDAPKRIADLAKQPKLKGLRPMLQDLADVRWILQDPLAPAIQAMVQHCLVFDALIEPVHIPHILTLARRYPALRIVIDHAAKPDIANNAWQPWAEGIAQLAQHLNVVCKLSGLLTQAGPAPVSGATQPWAAHVLQCFGWDRVLWGSDWPVLELAASYSAWCGETRQFLAGCSAHEQQAILGDNAQRIYQL